MILVTGAAGKTGLAVLRALSDKGAATRAYIHRPQQEEIARSAGAEEITVGGFADRGVAAEALKNIEAIYFICPNVHPHEFQIGDAWIKIAKAMGVPRFVYHSVLFPQIEAMPHHWHKHRVEEALVQSGLDFTIFQPASYMQNILPYWPEIVSKGLYRVPYSAGSRFSPVDLKDVAEAAAIVLLQNGHSGGIYQLAGPEVLSSAEMAVRMEKQLGHAVQAESQPLLEWMISAKNLSQYARDSLGQMFAYYDQHGFWSSSLTLENLLGRPPTSFATFLQELSK
jgi:uncharacterized protein YbjT (DUF2867 family)